MDEKRRKELEAKGFRVGSAAEFLKLTPEEEAFVEIRLELSSLIKSRRNKIGWTQEQLATAIGSSQSRIAKMEAGDSEITLDLMVKALLKLGVSRQEIGKLLEGRSRTGLKKMPLKLPQNHKKSGFLSASVANQNIELNQLLLDQ